MRFSKGSKDAAEELANVLKHNKDLLNNEENLKLVLEIRFAKKMGEAFQEGKEAILLSDMSSLNLNVPKGLN